MIHLNLLNRRSGIGRQPLVISCIKKGPIPKAKVIKPSIDQTGNLPRLSETFEGESENRRAAAAINTKMTINALHINMHQLSVHIDQQGHII